MRDHATYPSTFLTYPRCLYIFSTQYLHFECVREQRGVDGDGEVVERDLVAHPLQPRPLPDAGHVLLVDLHRDGPGRERAGVVSVVAIVVDDLAERLELMFHAALKIQI